MEQQATELWEMLRSLDDTFEQRHQFIAKTVEILESVPTGGKPWFSKFIIVTGVHVKVVDSFKHCVRSHVVTGSANVCLCKCVKVLSYLCTQGSVRAYVFASGITQAIAEVATQTDDLDLFEDCLRVLEEIVKLPAEPIGYQKDYSVHIETDFVSKCLSMLHVAPMVENKQCAVTILRFLSKTFYVAYMCSDRHRTTVDKIVLAICIVLAVTPDDDVTTLAAALRCLFSIF